VTIRHILAVALLGIGLWSAFSGKPAPTPAPGGGDIVLAGKFAGPTAAADAAIVAAMFTELSDEIEYDGQRAGGPLLTTGVAFDDLRSRAFDLRCRGAKVGDRQPRAREAIKAYLDATLGVSGGPVGPDQRSKWVASLREVGRAASDVSR